MKEITITIEDLSNEMERIQKEINDEAGSWGRVYPLLANAMLYEMRTKLVKSLFIEEGKKDGM